jgi:hypothetical protein
VAGETTMEAEALAEPLAPVQVRVYVALAVGETTAVPEVGWVPPQAPVAVQAVAFVELQVSVEL